MTKHEQIKTHLRMIRQATTPASIRSIHTIVATVEKELDAIEDLLRPETETLASSVLRLTYEEHLKEFAKLRVEIEALKLQLTQKTGCLRNRWYKIQVLEEKLDAVTRSNAYLRGCNNRLEQDLTKRERYTEARKRHIKNLNQDFDAVARNNTSLRKMLQEKKDLLEILKEDRRAAFEQGYSVCSRASQRK